jgi:hypothetical protein
MIERFFYTDCDKAKVIIENPNEIKRLTIVVNEREINSKLKKDENTIIDISEYIIQGTNKISYIIDDEDCDFTKSLQVYVEIKEAKNE